MSPDVTGPSTKSRAGHAEAHRPPRTVRSQPLSADTGSELVNECLCTDSGNRERSTDRRSSDIRVYVRDAGRARRATRSRRASTEHGSRPARLALRAASPVCCVDAITDQALPGLRPRELGDAPGSCAATDANLKHPRRYLRRRRAAAWRGRAPRPCPRSRSLRPAR